MTELVVLLLSLAGTALLCWLCWSTAWRRGWRAHLELMRRSESQPIITFKGVPIRICDKLEAGPEECGAPSSEPMTASEIVARRAAFREDAGPPP